MGKPRRSFSFFFEDDVGSFERCEEYIAVITTCSPRSFKVESSPSPNSCAASVAAQAVMAASKPTRSRFSWCLVLGPKQGVKGQEI